MVKIVIIELPNPTTILWKIFCHQTKSSTKKESYRIQNHKSDSPWKHVETVFPSFNQHHTPSRTTIPTTSLDCRPRYVAGAQHAVAEVENLL